jgi:NAD-dependent dihydropyrimidine dehydrogenase PreA subunit
MSGGSYMGIPREAIPWYPRIDPELCINDRACLDFCSNDVFAEANGSTIVANPLNCVVGCSACTSVCPTGALTFPDQQELVEGLRRLRQEYARL